MNSCKLCKNYNNGIGNSVCNFCDVQFNDCFEKKDNIISIYDKYFNSYKYAINIMRKKCNFYFDYEDLSLWYYYKICLYLEKYDNINTDYSKLITSHIIKRCFQYYKRNKKNFEICSDIINKDEINEYYENFDDFIYVKNNVVYDYVINKLTVREIMEKYKITQYKFYKILNDFYNKEIRG